MPDSVADLVRRGRALPPEEREQLVEQLLESLNQAGASELDPTWEAEIARRLDEYDRGAVTSIAAEEVFAKAARLTK